VRKFITRSGYNPMTRDAMMNIRRGAVMLRGASFTCCKEAGSFPKKTRRSGQIVYMGVRNAAKIAEIAMISLGVESAAPANIPANIIHLA
jgi:hypothetical protein